MREYNKLPLSFVLSLQKITSRPEAQTCPGNSVGTVVSTAESACQVTL